MGWGEYLFSSPSKNITNTKKEGGVKMELLFIVPGLFCLTGIALIVAAVALATARRATVPAAAQQAQNQNAPATTSAGPTPGGTIAISAILGQLVPASGPAVTVVEGVVLGREALNPDDDAITRGDHVVFHKVSTSGGTLVIAEVLHSNGIEVGGRGYADGRAQIADGVVLKIGTTEFTFRKA